MSLFKILREVENKTQSSVYLTGKYVHKFLTCEEKYKVNDVIIIGITSKVVKCLNRFGKYSKTNKTYKYNNTKLTITIINIIKNKTNNELLKNNSNNKCFTIFSLYLPINSTKKSDIIDFVGGLKDINKKRIKLIGNIKEKLKTNKLLQIQAISLSIDTNYIIDKNIMSIQKKICMEGITKKDTIQLKECLTKIVTSITPSKYFKLLKKLKLLKMILPELADCINIKQDLHFHKYDVFTHCIYTCDHIDNDLILRLAALFHDVGKVQTAKKINEKITFHKHEVASMNIAKQRLKILGFDLETITKICLLIRLHMYHYTREYTDTGVRRFIKKSKLTKEDIKDLSNFSLFKLRIADRLGSGIKNIPITDRQKDFEKRILQVYNEMYKFTIKNLNISAYIINERFHITFSTKIMNGILKFLIEKVKKNIEKNKEKTLVKLTVDYLYDINYWKENKMIFSDVNIIQ